MRLHSEIFRLKRRRHKYALVFLDAAILNAAFWFALKLHAKGEIDLFSPRFPFIVPEMTFFAVYSFAILVVFEINHLYRINVYLSATSQFQLLLKSLLYAILGLALLSFWAKSDLVVDSRLVLLYFFALAVCMLALGRIFLFRGLFRFCARRDLLPRSVLIVGATPAGIKLVQDLGSINEYGVHVVGILDDEARVGSEISERCKILGKIEDVARIVKERSVHEVVVCLESELDERYLEILDHCAETAARVMVASTRFGVVARNSYQEHYCGTPVLSIMNCPRRLRHPVLKRIADPFLACVAILILSPLFMIIGAAIKLDSPGPVFYSQMRVGRNGRQFRFFKFRTMFVGSDRDRAREDKLKAFINGNYNGTGPSTKIVDQRRVTKVGKVLRKSSLDELPQLFNVLMGDMSLVGPRPCLPYEWNSYAKWQKRRLSVVPGCTGIWQVLARSKVGFIEMVVLDLYYTYNISFHLDVWILFRTIPVMLFGSGGE